jgi:hypothetical protein
MIEECFAKHEVSDLLEYINTKMLSGNFSVPEPASRSSVNKTKHTVHQLEQKQTSSQQDQEAPKRVDPSDSPSSVNVFIRIYHLVFG